MKEFLFIGERRSKKAQENGWSWQTCQKFGPRLCARQLFTALEEAGIDPYEQHFLNLWTDTNKLDQTTLIVLDNTGKPIVGMGRRVNNQLTKWEIPHIEIVHPAARGVWRRQEVYNKHVRQKLCSNS